MRTTNEQFRKRWMLSLKTLANCSGTISFSVASPSPSRVNAVRCGSAASNRMGAERDGAILAGYKRQAESVFLSCPKP